MKLLVCFMRRSLKIPFKILQIIDHLHLMKTFCEIFRPQAQCDSDVNLAGVAGV